VTTETIKRSALVYRVVPFEIGAEIEVMIRPQRPFRGKTLHVGSSPGTAMLDFKVGNMSQFRSWNKNQVETGIPVACFHSTALDDPEMQIKLSEMARGGWGFVDDPPVLDHPPGAEMSLSTVQAAMDVSFRLRLGSLDVFFIVLSGISVAY
jgi:hypothetical protein